MAKFEAVAGDDLVVEQVDKAYGGARLTVLKVDGNDGSVYLGSTALANPPIKIGPDGAVTVNGTSVVSSITGDTTALGNTTLAANKSITYSAGTGALDASLGTGVTKTTTGLNTIGGDLLMAAGKIVGFGAPQALSGAGAVNVTTLVTLFTSTGAGQALTLADGTRAGQLKIIAHVVDGGSGVLTPTTKTSFTTLTLTAVYDCGVIMWDGSAWRPVLATGSAAFA